MSESQLNNHERMVESQRIVIPCSDSFEFVAVRDIVRCEGLQNYSRVYLKDGSMLVCTSTIGVLKRGLSSLGFICCHKSHLINIAYVVRFVKEGYVQLSDESCVPVSRRQKAQFMEQVVNRYNLFTEKNEAKPLNVFCDPLSINRKISSNDT